MSSKPKAKKEPPPAGLNGADWGSSEAKQLIAQDMFDDLIPYKEPIKDYEALFNKMYKGQPEFDNFPWDLTRHKDRIKRLQTTVRRMKWDRNKDAEALKQARAYYGHPTHYPNGKPVWRGSEASKQLDEDHVDGKCEGKCPAEVYKMHPELHAPFGLKRLTQRLEYYKEKAKPHGENPVQAAKKELKDKKKVKICPEHSRKDTKEAFKNE